MQERAKIKTKFYYIILNYKDKFIVQTERNEKIKYRNFMLNIE